VDLIHEACRVDPWFLREIKKIVDIEERVERARPPEERQAVPTAESSRLLGCTPREAFRAERGKCHALRQELAVAPVFKRVDTCAAEFAAPTAYMYSTYETPFAQASRMKRGPPKRPRSSSSAAGRTASARGSSSTIAAATPPSHSDEAGFESIMVNCNPETVSTDYDTSDRLYFRAPDRRRCPGDRTRRTVRAENSSA